MSNTYRDPNPPERPLAFDGYAERPRRGPAPITLILSLLILGGVGGGILYLYRGGVRGPDGPPEPVGVPIRDVRVAAPPQAPAPDPAAGLSIYRDDPSAVPGAPKFAPPPEQSFPRPVAIGATIPATPTAPVVAAMAPPSGASGAPSVAGQANARPAKPPTIDTLLAAAPETASAKPATATLAIATAKPTPAKPAAVKLATAKPAAVAHASPAGGYVVQIGAFSSPSLAEKSWSSAASLAPSAMAGKGEHVATVTGPSGATLYRTAITGFDTRESAQALCAKLAATGRTCFVR